MRAAVYLYENVMRGPALRAPSAAGAPRAWPAAARRRRWWIATLVVAAAHLGLLWLLPSALVDVPQRAPRSAPTLVLVPPRAAPVAPAPAPVAKPAPPEPASPAPAPPRTVAAPPTQPREAASAPAAEPAPSLPSAPPAPPVAAASAASAPLAAASAPGGSLLDTEASRRAIREAARQRSTGELGAAASGEPAALSEQERLGREIARGAYGDCLKGEFAGAGMGLFSLPFWLLAEMRDKCRR